MCLQPLLRLIEKQHHRTLILWSFYSVELLLEIFEKVHQQETRPRIAYELTGIVRKYSTDFERRVTVRIKAYEEVLYHIEQDVNLNQYAWAAFLLQKERRQEK